MTGHQALAVTAAGEPLRAAQAGDLSEPLRDIDPAQVEVGGEIGRRIDLTIQANLLKLDVEKDFLPPFHAKQATAWYYVGLGKLIDASVHFARYSKNSEVLAFKDRLIRELLATQLDDGYIGTFQPQARLHTLWDLHEIAYILQALVDDERCFRNAASLDAARKLGNYVLANRLGTDRDAKIPDTGKLNIERALIALSEATGDARYRDYAVAGMDLRHWQPSVFDNPIYGPGYNHVYTFMNLCLAQLDLYREQADPALLASSHNVMDFLINSNGLMVTGTCSHDENFHMTQDAGDKLGESCATAYLIRLAHRLLQVEGLSLQGDLMERAIFNALFAAQSPDGRQLRYFTAAEGQRAYWMKDTYCCPNNWRRLVAELTKMIYYRSADGGALVNLYTASSADVHLADDLSVRLRQETDYPNSGRVVITIDPSRSAKFPLRLRIPRWCRTAALTVNGRPARGVVKPGDWHTIQRRWKAGDVVTLEMPMDIRLVRGRARQAGKVTVMRGPVVFCLAPSRQSDPRPPAAFDFASLTGPVPDATIRPDGLALNLRAWSPDHDRTKPADMALRLTEFVDPHGEQTYLPPDDPTLGVEDELCASPNPHG